uniref:Tail fiber protein n=1 Tax=Pseudomonas phage HRDY3 TaxID=3236930 RepID=A0AB39CDY3_9VIRU
MALIYADDFQQWATAASSFARSNSFINAPTAASVMDEIQSLGFFPPGSCLGTTGDASRYMTLNFDPARPALRVSQFRPLIASIGAAGLRRQFSYEGDTLYFGITLELAGSAQYPGDFLFFGNVDSPVFTSADCIGPMLYSVGADANGFYTFNGVSTTTLAYARPASFKAVIDCVFGPDYMELWVNNVRIAQQPRANYKLKDFAVSVAKIISGGTGIDLSIYVHSVIVADNVTPGFAQRVGRRTAKTEPVVSTPVIESQVVVQNNQTALQLLGRFASGPTTETDTQMLGNLSSPLFGVKNDFGSTRSATRKPLAAAVMLQTKRFEPSADGLSPLAYMTIAGNKIYGKKLLPSSTWKNNAIEIPIATGQDFSTFNFGYEHDYKDQNRVYVVDRDKTEVYGDSAIRMKDWWNANDLVAFDSSLFNAAGFNDFNGNQIISTSRVANTLPFLGTESFKYGTGIDLNTTGALLANVAQGSVMTSPWTIDFWFKESANDLLTAWQLYCYQAVVGNYLMICPNNPTTTQMAIWNQSQNVAAGAQGWTVWKSNTAWRHSAVVYDGSKLSFYIDGVLQGSITWTILSFSKPFGVSHRGFWGYDVTASRIIIERYRMRAGAQFAGNFNPDTIYG